MLNWKKQNIISVEFMDFYIINKFIVQLEATKCNYREFKVFFSITYIYILEETNVSKIIY